jgi:SulP family sulfate permease
MIRFLKGVFPGLTNIGTEAWDPRADVVTGISIALLLVPQSMAYAELAGLPAYYGLYAAIVPVLLGGLFGTVYHLGTGPVAMTSIITASALVPLATPGTSEYVQLALLLAMLVGLMRIALSVFRLSAIVNLISHPVVTAFTNAGALIIAASQVPALLGLTRSRNPGLGGFVLDLVELGGQLGRAHIPSILFGVATIAIVLGLKRWMPKLPGVLVAVALGIGASVLLGYEARLGGGGRRCGASGAAAFLLALGGARETRRDDPGSPPRSRPRDLDQPPRDRGPGQSGELPDSRTRGSRP